MQDPLEPAIWRRIQISDLCSFWDLHVAIQDAMGWLDYHLHHFEMNYSIVEGKHFMGIPGDEDYGVYKTLPGWDYRVRDYLVINERFIEAIATPRHPERKELLEWVGGKYDPNTFDPKKVKFDNPTKRWKNAFKRDVTF